MLQLPNGCSCSTPSISPKNWNKPGASLKRMWYVQYYFHDPLQKEKYPRGKFVQVKGGMNSFHSLSERRQAAKTILDGVLSNLLDLGYNPITGIASEPEEEPEYEISPETPFIKALRRAYSRVSYVKNTMENLGYVLNYVEKSAIQLRFDKLAIKEIRKKHVRLTIENVSKIKPYWSANQFNYYRSYLGMLFSELLELDAVDSNYSLSLKKQKGIKKAKKILTTEERVRINNHLKIKHYSFWRYMQIFFHSGSRTTELLRLKVKDVNLKKQEMKLLIKKGRQFTEVYKPIKNIAVKYLAEILNDANSEDFVFSKDLEPGQSQIDTKQISKRWRTHVKSSKTGLGIDSDFYWLKHLNTTEVTDILCERMNITQAEDQAAEMNSHTTSQMVKGVYDTKNKSRKDNAFKSVWNEFA